MKHSKTTSKKKKERKSSTRILRWFIFISSFVIFSGALTICLGYYYFSQNLPKIISLTDYRPSVVTAVYSEKGQKIAEFYRERRIIVPLSALPDMLIKAFIAAEDARFFKHQGVDILSIFRALLKNIKAGTIVQGGSTITQQVAKSFFLTPEKNYTRKIKEAILAYRMNKYFTKKEILFLYLNQIYLGHGAYGVEAASENYFGKSAGNLNIAECAMLAGLPQAPSRYSPFKNPKMAINRQIYVLNRMVEENYISNLQAAKAINTKIEIKPRKNWFVEKVPFYTEHIRRYIEKKYGENVLYNEGLEIHACVNVGMQNIAREEILKGLKDLDKRRGYRGPLKNLAPEEIELFSQNMIDKLINSPIKTGKILKGVIIAFDNAEKSVVVRMGNEFGKLFIQDMKWARKPNSDVCYYDVSINDPKKVLNIGDVILVKVMDHIKDSTHWRLSLEQNPTAQAALLCLEAETGYIKAMVGGRNFIENQFNRAIQSRRQPGSAFKPIIYAAALDNGYTPATMLIDTAIVYKNSKHNFEWKPKNYKKTFHGPTLFREALAMSRNIVTIKILKDIGIDYVIEYANKLGIKSRLSRNLSIALGSSGISLLEIVNAYSVFTNLGYLAKPIFITKIFDRDGNIIEKNEIEKDRVIDKNTAYIMTSLLESVIIRGTGRRVKKLKRPAAGKTGTTNNLNDAWFVGYTPDFVTGTWVGFDEETSLGKGETGSRTASPVWLGFMQRILQDKPVKIFHVPSGVVFAKIDPKTGLLPTSGSKKTIFECFKEGTVPEEHNKQFDTIVDSDQFYKQEL